MKHRGVHFEEEPNHLTVSWDNRTVRKDRFTFWFLMIFWIVWAPATCIATVKIFSSESPVFFAFWCVFGWLGTIAIPLTFMQRYWREWIRVDCESISWGATGFFARNPKTLPFSRILEFRLGYRPDQDEPESVVSLNIYETPRRFGHQRRHLLGYWLSKEDKKLVFERMCHYASKRSLPLNVQIYE